MTDDTRSKPNSSAYLSGQYVTKGEALEFLRGINVNWTKRQIDWTAEPDADGHRRWPWFLDDKGTLRIDVGFVHNQFETRQREALRLWQEGPYI